MGFLFFGVSLLTRSRDDYKLMKKVMKHVAARSRDSSTPAINVHFIEDSLGRLIRREEG